MEHLELWLYLADLVDNIDSVTKGLIPLGLVGTVGSVVGYAIAKSEHSTEGAKIAKRGIGSFIFILGISIIFQIITPSSKTIYMILGVQAGKEVITSDTGKKAIELLNLTLDKQLNDMKGGK